MLSRNSRRIQGQAGAPLLPSATEVKGDSRTCPQLKMGRVSEITSLANEQKRKTHLQS